MYYLIYIFDPHIYVRSALQIINWYLHVHTTARAFEYASRVESDLYYNYEHMHIHTTNRYALTHYTFCSQISAGGDMQ